MKENIGFIVIFSAMMATILILHGCSQMGIREAQSREWRATLVSDKDGECAMTLDIVHGDQASDDSLTIDHRK